MLEEDKKSLQITSQTRVIYMLFSACPPNFSRKMWSIAEFTQVVTSRNQIIKVSRREQSFLPDGEIDIVVSLSP